MPQTFTGWILYAAILVAAGATSATATTLLMSVFGKAERDWWNIPAAYAFAILMLIATALFLWVEPKLV